MSRRVVVLMGGVSRERDVSLRSGKRVLEALASLGYDAVGIDPRDALDELLARARARTIDCVFVALHGTGGEDGTLQGFLTQLGLPYTGSKVLASAIGMHKVITKQLLLQAGFPTPDFCVIDPSKPYPDQAASMGNTLGFPVVVKPTSEGSSFGVQVVDTLETLPAVLEQTVTQFGSGFVEQYICGKEVTVGVLGVPGEERALPILELVPHRSFYDYEAKYTKGLTDFILPARLSEEATASIQSLALAVHRAVGCVGVSRVDMMVDLAGAPFVHEINTVPGLTELSDLPAQAAHVGISYPQLIETILASAR